MRSRCRFGFRHWINVPLLVIRSVKHLTEVDFLPNRTGGYWEDQGYDWRGGV
jgi:DMSO/TMAO reductase YedYZ molybdopterin-dependent catalytic subunit